MMVSVLSWEKRAEELAQLSGWTFDGDRNALYRKFVFRDFIAALGFMVRVGYEAEKADHQPEWTNVYNRVEIWLTTHDAGGVSQRDIELARIIDRLA
jgi:4a-hydroxytetrahydrobiopterin dehydratase